MYGRNPPNFVWICKFFQKLLFSREDAQTGKELLCGFVSSIAYAKHVFPLDGENFLWLPKWSDSDSNTFTLYILCMWWESKEKTITRVDALAVCITVL